MRSRRIIALVVAIAVVAAGSLAWTYLRRPQASSVPSTSVAREKIVVRLAWLHQAQFAGFYLAKEAGLYDAAGLDVEFKEWSEDSDAPAELAEGKIQFAVTSAEEVLRAADAGTPIKAISVIYQLTPYAFAALADSGIATPKDFAGRTLGAAGGNEQAGIVYRALLRNFDIPESSVKFSALGFDEVGSLVGHEADTVDLYRTDQPYKFRKAGINVNLILPERYGYQIYGDTLVTSDAMIAAEPETVRRFVAASMDGWRRAFGDRSAAIDATMKYAKGPYADRDYEEYILAESEPLIRPTTGFVIGSMSYASWQRSYGAYSRDGVVKNGLDATAFFAPEFVPH